ncbi:hypothetical protein PF008_g19360 [Phytophthora fragariae]|nr:hypothetical protein PF008_g19360 [Phytophthora fragariae]
MALAFGAAHAWTFDASEVAPPEDIVGEHQPLQRTWTVSSFAQLEQLYLAVPGRVFVGLDPSLLPATEAPSTEAPAKETPGVVSGVTPGVVPGFIPGAEPGFVPGAVAAGSLGGSGSGLITKAPSIEVPAKETPGVVSGVTPGVVPGVIPGAVPGFVPGAVAAGSLGGSGSGLITKAPSIEVPAKETPGVVSGVTPGVVPGFIPGAVPGFVPGAVAAGSLGGSGSGLITKAPSIEVPAKETPGVVSGVTPGVVPGFIPGAVPGFVPGAVAAGSLGVAGETIEIPTMMLRKHHRKHENDDEQQGEETVVAKIVITGNSTDLLNMIEAAPLHPRRNDGLKLHLKNEDAYGEGFVLTQIYLFEKNLLRRVTTAFSGDVVLNEDVVTLDDAEADVKLACVGDANLYLESSSNATLASLEVEVTGSGLVQLEIPSVNLEGSLDVEVAGSGSVALVTDALAAAEVKTTLSGSGNIVVDTSDLEAQKLDASVYGSGVSSFATAGAVVKETLTLSGPGQLLAGSIVARKSEVDVWGDGDMLVQVTDKLTVSTSVWGKVGYVNAPPTDVKIKGWWFWREASSIVYPAAVNKVLIYEPVTVPAKYPVYYSIETAESASLDDPDYAFVSAEPSSLTNLMTTSLSSVHQAADATTSDSNGLFYAFVGLGPGRYGARELEVRQRRSCRTAQITPWQQLVVCGMACALATEWKSDPEKQSRPQSKHTKMALTDAVFAPYAAAKHFAQSTNPVMLAALVAIVVVVNVVAAKSWQARRSRLEYSPLV